MREGILQKFKQDLLATLSDFEKESSGRHNRRPEISAAIVALEEYIDRAQNPLTLLNMIEVYIKNHLSGFLKSLAFRDEYKLRKRLLHIFEQPEYTLQSLSHSVYHESEIEKLSLYRLIAQLEERLKQLEREKEQEFRNHSGHSSQEFEELREKITVLEAREKEAQIKIEELENEKWLKEREAIALQSKVELLSEENSQLHEQCENLESDLEEMREENTRLKQGLHEKQTQQESLKITKKAAAHLVYQNNTKKVDPPPEENSEEERCSIM